MAQQRRSGQHVKREKNIGRKRSPSRSMEREQLTERREERAYRAGEQKTTATHRLNAIRRRRIQIRRAVVGISFVVIAFCIVTGVRMAQKYTTLKELQEQESRLTAQYEEELELSEELKDQEAYVQTDDYVEEMARKLGLLYPDEVIFKPEE